jgi:hypothetical protein
MIGKRRSKIDPKRTRHKDIPLSVFWKRISHIDIIYGVN